MSTNGGAYDYVIVGAGSAGCVLAYRLSADPAVRVLVLEAGGRDRHPLIHVPIGLGRMWQHRMFDWGYDSEPEPEMLGREIEAMRGKVLGGSSSINVMAYVRGHPGDYDRWAQKGCTGWSYADLLPYFKRCERWEGGEDAYRGGAGPLSVVRNRMHDPLPQVFLDSVAAAGWPITADYNGAEPEGFGVGQSTMLRGRRCSAAVAFLRPAMRRPNVTVETGALATRVLLDGTRAVGVEYARDGRTVAARAEREVILAGGVFNSPHLLMLSGIGPADHLREHGIRPVADLPGVGRNLQDHLGVYVEWDRPEAGQFRIDMRADRAAMAMALAYLLGVGPATILPGGVHGFVKTRPELAVPDLQFITRFAAANAHVWFPGFKPAYRDGVSLRPVLLHPESRGELTLRSADPRDLVRVRQNFLTAGADLATLRAGVRLARELAALQPFARSLGRETVPGPDATSDGDIDAFIRRIGLTAHHPSCTCAMGVGAEAVLDPELRVRGVEALRVVDAAAMPDLVSGNINACVLMIAEKGADMILGKEPLAAVH